MKRIAMCLLALALAAPVPASAHGGGTDANGCHVDSSTGRRHCHGGSSSSGSSSAPVNNDGAWIAPTIIFTTLAIGTGGLILWQVKKKEQSKVSSTKTLKALPNGVAFTWRF